MGPSRFAVAMTITAMFGCAAAPAPDKVPAPQNTPPKWSASADTRQVTNGWIAQFNDPKLQTLVKESLAGNLSIQALAANVEQSQALARQAGAALRPTLSGTAGSSRAGVLDGASDGGAYQASLQTSWELDLWGRAGAGALQAQRAAESVEADFLFAQYSIAANTAIAYFAAIDASKLLTIARENLGLLEETLRITSAQYEEGMASAQQLALARADIASSREQLLASEGAQRNALRALELLLGRYPSATAELSDEFPELPAVPGVGLPSELLERRPDVIAAERQVAAAFQALEQAKAARLPTISLSGSLGGSSNDLSRLLDPGNVAWSLGSSLLAPLYDGGVRRENVIIATAQQKAAIARYGETAIQAFGEVESALDQGQVLSQRYDLQTLAVSESKTAYDLARAQYDEGEISLIDLLSFQRRVISNQSTLLATQRLRLTNRIQLHLALGGSWE